MRQGGRDPQRAVRKAKSAEEVNKPAGYESESARTGSSSIDKSAEVVQDGRDCHRRRARLVGCESICAPPVPGELLVCWANGLTLMHCDDGLLRVVVLVGGRQVRPHQAQLLRRVCAM